MTTETVVLYRSNHMQGPIGLRAGINQPWKERQFSIRQADLPCIAPMAAFKHNLIGERTHAGFAAARACGRKGGRKPKLDDG